VDWYSLQGSNSEYEIDRPGGGNEMVFGDMTRLTAILVFALASIAGPAHADRTICQKWITVGWADDETEYLVDVWSIVDKGKVRIYNYEEDRSNAVKSSPDDYDVLGISSYHAVLCEELVIADIIFQDADLNKAQWRSVVGDAIASKEADVVCAADIGDRPQGVSSE
jgi:hypothetical protein